MEPSDPLASLTKMFENIGKDITEIEKKKAKATDQEAKKLLAKEKK